MTSDGIQLQVICPGLRVPTPLAHTAFVNQLGNTEAHLDLSHAANGSGPFFFIEISVTNSIKNSHGAPCHSHGRKAHRYEQSPGGWQLHDSCSYLDSDVHSADGCTQRA